MSDSIMAQDPAAQVAAASDTANPENDTAMQQAVTKGRAKKAAAAAATQGRAVANKLRNQQQGRDVVTLETAARITDTTPPRNAPS